MKLLKFFGLATLATAIGWAIGGICVLVLTARALAKGEFDMDAFLVDDDDLS